MEFRSREQVESYLRSTDQHEGSKKKSILSKVVEVASYLIEKSANSSLYTSVEEIQEILVTFGKILKNNRTLDEKTSLELSILFAPTGPIQEISIDGGWSKIFFLLAKIVDQILRI